MQKFAVKYPYDQKSQAKFHRCFPYIGCISPGQYYHLLINEKEAAIESKVEYSLAEGFEEKLLNEFIDCEKPNIYLLKGSMPIYENPPAAPEKADRYNEGKRKWSLVDFKSLEPLVEVLEFGSKKYSINNWKKGLDEKEILESMMRHLAALMDGEETDKESGISHMGHIQCNAMFYNYFKRKRDEI